jgi:hypothetical protein
MGCGLEHRTFSSEAIRRLIELGLAGGSGSVTQRSSKTAAKGRLLRSRRERPSRCRAAESRDELASPHHSITSSARASSIGGISRPSALAVCKLMTNSNLVACNTGMSAGFSPLRMRPT